MANARSLNGLIKWLGRDEWHEPFEAVLDRHVLPACDAASVEVEQVVSTLGRDWFMTTVWGSAFEDFLTREIDGRNIVDDYLKRRGWKESASAKSYMLALRNSVISLYEVSDIVRDKSFLARDLVRGGEPVLISERSATHSLHQWDHIATRVLRLGAATVISGCVLPLSHEVSEEILQLVRKTAGRVPKARHELADLVGCPPDDSRLDHADTVLLRAAASAFTTLWLNDILQRAINPGIPEVRNTDGDEIMFCTVHFPLAASATPADIQSALDQLRDMRRESTTFWNWVAGGKATKSRPAQKVSQPNGATTFLTTLDDGSIVLGNVELKDRTLVLSANSRPRADRGQALIAETLATLVGQPLVEMQTLQQLQASRASQPPPPPLEIPPDQQQLIVHAYLDKHYRQLLDESVPMLGNMSPRKAVRSAKNRSKVVTWLKTLENHSAKIDRTDPMATYDSTWLWNELGISDLRR
jgi:hypothetical protein